ncbi:MAG: hypothetical protein A3J54_01990 [Candidatus Ryanbacteria bacterium RIFCSPHIGHO2_02_FULL_45_13b]|uniref:Uncharacterized protein n=1 Tax=Candidatus Ryanbacteria bacterium RIFCSPHIGHO2_02_FULL_45_13b TaxID=1802117 RepID=A0A1G2G8B3_9BACT|nr:MAG: hypothetical protein A3J54_01990 [Candidatus Ryanbacteria bacterium RIFCSPHIGHO2_02_FULL_45_13b]
MDGNALFRKIPPACVAETTSARRRPAKIRKGGGAAPLKTAKEPGEKHRLEPYFAKPPIRFYPQN